MNTEYTDIIKETLPTVKREGEKIVALFYQNLFDKHPQLKNVFNMTHQKDKTQRQALFNSIIMLAEHIECPEELESTLDLIAHKHASVGVKKDHYPIVSSTLMEAVSIVLSIEPESLIYKSWLSAVEFAAEALLSKETELVAGRESELIKVYLSSVVTVAENVKSFSFKRIDGKNFTAHIPGQFISLDVEKNGWPHQMKRQYTVTGDPSDLETLTITTKLDTNGVVTSYMHNSCQVGDQFTVSEPFGTFTLDDTNEPILFMSAGIGITPIYSLIKECLRRGRRFQIVHGDRNLESIPFYNELKQLPNTIFLENPTTGFHQGYVDLREVSINEDQVYLCGPKGFMQSQIQFLRSREIHKIKYEFFGAFE